MSPIAEFIADPGALAWLRDLAVRLVMVLGASDSGKTTLVSGLADDLSRREAVAVVDLDMGQSRLGPPATVAWGVAHGGFRGWEAIRVEGFHFIGSFSPMGHLLPSLVGAKRMIEAALARCSKVIVDTTGLVAAPEGVVLKQHKIDLLSPDLVLALERADELAPILGGWPPGGSPRTVRIAVPAGVRLRGPGRRARYRTERLAAYFAGARNIEIVLAGIGVRHAKRPRRDDLDDLRGRLVALRDRENRDVALGVIVASAARPTRLLVRTPLPEGAPVHALVIGTAEIDPATYSP